jgi:hypothetical protein
VRLGGSRDPAAWHLDVEQRQLRPVLNDKPDRISRD